MKLFLQIIRKCKNICFGLLISTLLVCCKLFVQSTMPNSSIIIRHNLFDTNYYKLNSIDTNKVSKELYKKVFEVIDFNSSTKCFLMEVNYPNVIQKEYGLYDYSNGKYYYALIQNSHLIFRQVNSTKSKEMYEMMKNYFKDEYQLSEVVKDLTNQRRHQFDFGMITSSIIKVNYEKNEIIVKSFHW